MPQGLSDPALVARAREGDETAFVVLYERHRDAVFRFAWRMLGAVEAAEDVAHDCFLALLRDPTRFDAERASLRTYLCAAARNQVLKRLRDGGRESDCEVPDVADHREPLGRLLEAETAELVRDAVSALVPLQRETLILVEYEGLTLAEVAEVVCADLGTVKARLHRAREALRRRLAPLKGAAPSTVGGRDGGRS